ncbi:MAG: hypothetical protein C4523_15440 [Myxococcales bacterium]|nr:MAG: hypothetical protein C4523_15440 [Myxococcales bacterium]
MNSRAAGAWIIGWLAFLAAPAIHAESERLYLFPIQFPDDVPQEERRYAENVYREEVAAFFWLVGVHADNAAEVLGEPLAAALAKCPTPKCALPTLKRAGVGRFVVVTVAKVKRRQYQIDAQIADVRGKILARERRLEPGGPSELKYALPGVLERLFQGELDKHSSMVTAIVETDAITGDEADEMMAKADDLAAEGKPAEALAQYKSAGAESPDLALPWIKAARLALEKGDDLGADDAAREAVRRAPRDAEARLIAARVALKLERTEEAREHLEAALHLDAGLVEVHYLLGRLLVEEGRTSEALARFEALVKLAPSHPGARANLGLLYLDVNRPRQARAALEEAIKLDPALAPAYGALGRAGEALKDWRAAARAYAKQAELEPSADGETDAGRMCDLAGDAKAAEAAFRRALTLDPVHPDATVALGLLLVRAGQQTEGRQWLERYVKIEERPEREALVKHARDVLSK